MLSVPAQTFSDQISDFGKTLLTYTQGFNTSVLRLGVTGLSRSGKTVFITALIHNLINNGRLPFFQAQIEGRISKAYLEPQPNDTLPRFAYEHHLAKLYQDTPEWPDSTSQISQLRLTIEFIPKSFLKQQFGRGKLHIDIIDYPGEWLLDLPLLDINYTDWSRQVLTKAQQQQTSPFAEKWLRDMKALDPLTEQNEALAEKLSKRFQQYLSDYRNENNIFFAHAPGRFLMPGDLAGSPALTFSPLFLENNKRTKAPNKSLWELMARRFKAYQEKVIKPFFRNHFVRLDRQIVLVDLLSALNVGPEAVKTTEMALSDILNCFQPGKRSWLTTFWSRPIERIVFAATKADHIHHTSHDTLETLMTRVVEDAIKRAQFAQADVKTVALASLRATREAKVKRDDDTLPSIVGIPIHKDQETNMGDLNPEQVIFPGDLPNSLQAYFSSLDKTSEKTQSRDLNLVPFHPPRLEYNDITSKNPWPHIRLDRAIEFLIGDKVS